MVGWCVGTGLSPFTIDCWIRDLLPLVKATIRLSLKYSHLVTPYQLQHPAAWHRLDLNMKDRVKSMKNDISIIT